MSELYVSQKNMRRIYIHTILAAICIWQLQAEEKKVEGEVKAEAVKNLDPESFIKNLKKGMSHRQVSHLVRRLNIKTLFVARKNKNSGRLIFRRDVNNPGDLVVIDMEFLNGKLDKWTSGYQR